MYLPGYWPPARWVRAASSSASHIRVRTGLSPAALAGCEQVASGWVHMPVPSARGAGRSGGVERHRAVGLVVALEQRHRADALLPQLPPRLADPGLRVGLRGE